MKKITLKIITLCMFLIMGTYVMAQTQYNLTLQVDMTNAETFDPTIDDIFVSGSFAGWTQPGEDMMYKLEPLEEGSMIYALTATVDSGEVQYKYFRVIDGAASWDNGEWTGDPNRKIYLTADATIENVWANMPYEITFNVDMTNADPFDPTTDEIYIAGSLANGWAQPGTMTNYKLTPTEENEMIYTINLLLYNGDYMYKYFRIIDGEASWDNGEWLGDPNREITVDSVMTFNDVWNVPNLGIFSIDNSFNYKIFPNPVKNELTINGISKANKIEVYDMTGRLLKTIELQNTEETSINASELNNGVYFIRVYNKVGVQTAKFIKN